MNPSGLQHVSLACTDNSSKQFKCHKMVDNSDSHLINGLSESHLTKQLYILQTIRLTQTQLQCVNN